MVTSVCSFTSNHQTCVLTSVFCLHPCISTTGRLFLIAKANFPDMPRPDWGCAVFQSAAAVRGGGNLGADVRQTLTSLRCTKYLFSPLVSLCECLRLPAKMSATPPVRVGWRRRRKKNRRSAAKEMFSTCSGRRFANSGRLCGPTSAMRAEDVETGLYV